MALSVFRDGKGEAVVAELYSFIVVYFFRCKVKMFDLVCNTFFGLYCNVRFHVFGCVILLLMSSAVVLFSLCVCNCNALSSPGMGRTHRF